MPLYEYRCIECGDEFEKRLSFSEADQLPVCPKCASPKTQKRLSKVVSFGAASAGSTSSVSSNCGSRGGFS
jgi:putative FmdB family regulatory protein